MTHGKNYSTVLRSFKHGIMESFKGIIMRRDGSLFMSPRALRMTERIPGLASRRLIRPWGFPEPQQPQPTADTTERVLPSSCRFYRSLPRLSVRHVRPHPVHHVPEYRGEGRDKCKASTTESWPTSADPFRGRSDPASGA